MSEVQSGLEGVVAFATEIAEPDREGGALRYRGVDIEDLVGRVPFERVWGLLVDARFEPGMPPAEPHPLSVRSGDPRVDVQSALAMLGPEWGFEPLIDVSDEQARDQLARASVMALSFVAQSARGSGRPPVSQGEVDRASSIPERFLIRWRGEADPDHVKAIDAYWISAAEHGMNASTFTARVVASTGADVAAALSAAVGALSGPLHGGAPARVLKMLDEVEQSGDAGKWVKQALDRGERLMGFGHRVYRAEDPRAAVLRRTSREIGSARFEVAEALEQAALAELKARKPDRVLATNVEFWSAVVLDHADVPATLFTSMFTCARTAGWAAHILEQKREGRLIRPSAKYVGPAPRELSAVV
ncbi:MAG: citrate synthase 2 [Solirubrobacteraceae bacterium]